MTVTGGTISKSTSYYVNAGLFLTELQERKNRHVKSQSTSGEFESLKYISSSNPEYKLQVVRQ